MAAEPNNLGPAELWQGSARTRYLQDAMACYLAHVERRTGIRALAEKLDLHPSTVSRRIAKVEQLRDDPAIDAFLSRASVPGTHEHELLQGPQNMNIAQHSATKTSSGVPDSEELRALRRLCESGAFLVVMKGLKNAVVMRSHNQGDPVRTAVVASEVIGRLAARDWIMSKPRAKVVCYEVTSAGRAALKRRLADRKSPGSGLCEAPSAFAEQHKAWGERKIKEPGAKRARKVRVNLAESPLTMLARKKNPDGSPFLSKDHLAAGERLREDFELAQIGPRVAQNWDRFLTGADRGNFGNWTEGGSSAAQARVARAMTALGEGLSDIALRCCCFLEGLEAAEKRMGWSARSGKIVLRIALTRLARHYAEDEPDTDRRIG